VRLTPLRLALLFGAAVFVLGPTTALTRPDGKPLKGGDPKGGSQQPGDDLDSRGKDPAKVANRLFDRFAKSKDVIIVDDIKSPKWDPALREKAQAYAQAKSIIKGQLTREQFVDFMREQAAQEQSGGPMGGGGGPGRDLDAEAEQSFRRHDSNNNGVLTPDEMPRALRDELAKWDKDKSGTINLAEYKEYYKARMGSLRPDRPQGGSNAPNSRAGTARPDGTDGGDPRPAVYKYGNWPKEVPAWFAQLDTDKDGQVGLYEWKKAGGDIRKFVEMDRNGDGFLTVEEVLHYQKLVAAARKAEQAAGGAAAVDEQGNPKNEYDPTSPTTPKFTFRPPGGRQPGGK